MPAFAYKSRFREGQWRAFRRFMLEERRDASARYDVIKAEKERIGEVYILYGVETDNQGGRVVTERRVGVEVSSAQSNIGKLLAAYVSLGGNPFDISMFLSPDSDVGTSDGAEAEKRYMQPGGGILNPNNIKYSYDQSVTSEDTNLRKYRPSRSGGSGQSAKDNEVATIMERDRRWISQEARYKRTRIEEHIIKLCDLREQLDLEIEDMIWATRGNMEADELFDPQRYTESLTAANVAYFFDSTFRVPDGSDAGRVPYDNKAASGAPGSVNLGVLSGFTSLVSDDDSEDHTAF